MKSRTENGEYELIIPNRGIYKLIKDNIYQHLKIEAADKPDDSRALFDAIVEGKPEDVERIFSDYLIIHISIRGTNVKKEMKENFYHGYLLGVTIPNLKT